MRFACVDSKHPTHANVSLGIHDHVYMAMRQEFASYALVCVGAFGGGGGGMWGA